MEVTSRSMKSFFSSIYRPPSHHTPILDQFLNSPKGNSPLSLCWRWMASRGGLAWWTWTRLPPAGHSGDIQPVTQRRKQAAERLEWAWHSSNYLQHPGGHRLCLHDSGAQRCHGNGAPGVVE